MLCWFFYNSFRNGVLGYIFQGSVSLIASWDANTCVIHVGLDCFIHSLLAKKPFVLHSQHICIRHCLVLHNFLLIILHASSLLHFHSLFQWIIHELSWKWKNVVSLHSYLQELKCWVSWLDVKSREWGFLSSHLYYQSIPDWISFSFHYSPSLFYNFWASVFDLFRCRVPFLNFEALHFVFLRYFCLIKHGSSNLPFYSSSSEGSTEGCFHDDDRHGVKESSWVFLTEDSRGDENKTFIFRFRRC